MGVHKGQKQRAAVILWVRHLLNIVLGEEGWDATSGEAAHGWGRQCARARNVHACASPSLPTALGCHPLALPPARRRGDNQEEMATLASSPANVAVPRTGRHPLLLASRRLGARLALGGSPFCRTCKPRVCLEPQLPKRCIAIVVWMMMMVTVARGVPFLGCCCQWPWRWE